jgi:hypothetical protein
MVSGPALPLPGFSSLTKRLGRRAVFNTISRVPTVSTTASSRRIKQFPVQGCQAIPNLNGGFMNRREAVVVAEDRIVLGVPSLR